MTIGKYNDKIVASNPTPTTYSIVANNACSSKNCGDKQGDDGYAGFAVAALAYNQTKSQIEDSSDPGLFYDPIVSEGSKGSPFGSYGGSDAKDFGVTAVSWIVPYTGNGTLDTDPIYKNNTVWFLVGSSNGVVYLCYIPLLDSNTTYIDPWCQEKIVQTTADQGGGYTNGGVVEMLYLPRSKFLIIMDFALNFYFFDVTFDIPNSPEPTITATGTNSTYDLGSSGSGFSGTSDTYQNGYKWLPRVSFQQFVRDILLRFSSPLLFSHDSNKLFHI